MLRRFIFVSLCLLLPLSVASAQPESAEAPTAKLSAEQTTAYFATIDDLLDTAKKRYAAGNTDAANEALIEAYLENFEHLEAPLEQVDAELNEELEETLREELRELVTTGVSPKAFSAAVDAAQAELDRAESLLLTRPHQ